jgi:hypothetical protein
MRRLLGLASILGALAFATGANAETPAPFGPVFLRNEAPAGGIRQARLLLIADAAPQPPDTEPQKKPVRPARPRHRMRVIKPPMGGAMPVIPPPSGGTTPVIPPPK